LIKTYHFMTTHQIITGALNYGEGVFAIGSVEGVNFTVRLDWKWLKCLRNRIFNLTFAGMCCWLWRGHSSQRFPTSSDHSRYLNQQHPSLLYWLLPWNRQSEYWFEYIEFLMDIKAFVWIFGPNFWIRKIHPLHSPTQHAPHNSPF